MSWVSFGLVGVVLFWCGFLVCWLSLRRRKSPRISRIDADELRGDEKKVYDFVAGKDGECGAWILRTGLGWSEKKAEKVLGEMIEKKILRERRFGNKRMLEICGFLRKRDREVLEFVRERSRVSVGDVERGLGMDDNTLLKVGKRLVRLGKVRKVSVGYDVVFEVV